MPMIPAGFGAATVITKLTSVALSSLAPLATTPTAAATATTTAIANITVPVLTSAGKSMLREMTEALYEEAHKIFDQMNQNKIPYFTEADMLEKFWQDIKNYHDSMQQDQGVVSGFSGQNCLDEYSVNNLLIHKLLEIQKKLIDNTIDSLKSNPKDLDTNLFSERFEQLADIIAERTERNTKLQQQCQYRLEQNASKANKKGLKILDQEIEAAKTLAKSGNNKDLLHLTLLLIKKQDIVGSLQLLNSYAKQAFVLPPLQQAMQGRKEAVDILKTQSHGALLGAQSSAKLPKKTDEGDSPSPPSFSNSSNPRS